MTKKRLGKGLDALLGHEEGGAEAGSIEGAELIKAPADRIDPNPHQPRRHFAEAELEALAESIRTHGVLQPILVRAKGDRFELIAGERRWRAAMRAQVHLIPARVLDLDDRRVAELAMVENLQREDLSALEKGQAFRDYLAKFHSTQEDLATRLGIDRSTVSNLIRLLDLPEEVQAAIAGGAISQGHGRALLALPGAEAQVLACRKVIAEGLTVRQTEALVAAAGHLAGKTRVRKDDPGSLSGRAPHFADLESHLREFLGTPVAVKPRSGSADKGQIVIEFNSREEFERVAALIRSY